MSEPVKIPVIPGAFAIVDADCIHLVSPYKWYLTGDKRHAIAHKKQVDKQRGTIYMHRLILPVPSGYEIDHINADGLDNRRVNLRRATKAQNMMNMRKRPKCSSTFKGVTWRKDEQKWSVCITHNKKTIYLGRFTTELEAAAAYNTKATELFGPFARLNDIPSPPTPHPTRQPSQEKEVLNEA